MRKIIITGALFFLVVGNGCALLKEKRKKEGVGYQSSSTRFIGYKATVEIKAPLKEVEQYLLDTRNIFMTTSLTQMEPVSRNIIARQGDSAEYHLKIFGFSLPVKLILVYYQPGGEFWLVALSLKKSATGMGVCRVKFKELPQGTKVTVSMEMQEEGANLFLRSVARAFNAWEMLADFMDQGAAEGQVRFDPSLTVKGLLAKGRRGELYDLFYQRTQYRIRIDAAPEKVSRALTNPETWEKFQEKYDWNLDRCLSPPAAGPCPIRINFSGVNLEGNSFLSAPDDPGLISAIWFFPEFKSFSQIQFFLKPRLTGTELTLDLEMDTTPAANSPGLVNFLMGSEEVRKTFEQMLLELKAAVEGTG